MEEREAERGRRRAFNEGNKHNKYTNENYFEIRPRNECKYKYEYEYENNEDKLSK